MRSGKSFWHAKITMENDFEENLTKNDTLEEDCNCSFFLHIICIERGDPHGTGYSNNIWD